VPEVLQHRLWGCHRIAMQDGLAARNFGLDQPPCQVDTPAAVGLGRVLSLAHLHVFVGRPVRMPYYHAPLERERERERETKSGSPACTAPAPLGRSPAPPRPEQHKVRHFPKPHLCHHRIPVQNFQAAAIVSHAVRWLLNVEGRAPSRSGTSRRTAGPWRWRTSGA
jgi:hypothetical protein